MNVIDSIDILSEYFNVIRRKRKGVITNFFLNPFKHSLWIEKGELYVVLIHDCYFIIRKSELVNYLFYITTDTEQLANGLKEILPTITFQVVIDLVGDMKMEPLKQIFLENGFSEFKMIYRMNRVGIPNCLTFDSNVQHAVIEDLNTIHVLLCKYFNPLLEQIPNKEEIEKFILENQVLIYKQDGKICGFVIFELIGLTLYLRYWFVSPGFRDLHIGSKLFNAFMYEGRNTKRQLLWVIADNENAIKRYKHYGFRAEKMFDYVLMREC
ncbi:GNAT family N-acetyltransferase [uncultured Bacteroides sp.]|uniref:GNAT family N-acetyltransferase n=1 Tax=uncultured Bacteroides sp. TaxID=162156 RepID=UPI0025DF945C|nr:GNAT family N-acetyltransferase [uncultured Bacteroides sp.]